MSRICFVLLLFVLPMLGGCSFPIKGAYEPYVRAPYQPSRYGPGYDEAQLDKDTYFIRYNDYFERSDLPGQEYWIHPLNEKLLQRAQEYVLYRAGELAQSKGAQYFAILLKDDWNLLGVRRIRHRGIQPHIEPGAGLVVRMLSAYPSSLQSNDDRVYEVGTLLQSLPRNNRGLAEYQKTIVHDESAYTTGNKFSRWRSSVSGYDSVPVPGTKQKTFWGTEYFRFEPGSATILQVPSGQFELAMWNDRPIWPRKFLAECVGLADREGFEAFKLVNWTVEEHRTDERRGNWKVWFRAKATVIPQHHKESDSLEPVFVVDEIRSNVMNYKW